MRRRPESSASVHADEEQAPSPLRDTEVLRIAFVDLRQIARFVKLVQNDANVIPSTGGQEPRHVLNQQNGRPQSFGDPDEFVEEAAPLAVESRALPGDAEVLAGEAPDEQINGAIMSPKLPRECLHPSDTLDVGPSPRQDALAEGVVLDLRDDREARPLKPEVESPDAGEEGDDIHPTTVRVGVIGASHLHFSCSGCLSTRGRDGTDHERPGVEPTSFQPAARRLAPGPGCGALPYRCARSSWKIMGTSFVSIATDHAG
jgi:hypothetical protein